MLPPRSLRPREARVSQMKCTAESKSAIPTKIRYPFGQLALKTNNENYPWDEKKHCRLSSRNSQISPERLRKWPVHPKKCWTSPTLVRDGQFHLFARPHRHDKQTRGCPRCSYRKASKSTYYVRLKDNKRKTAPRRETLRKKNWAERGARAGRALRSPTGRWPLVAGDIDRLEFPLDPSGGEKGEWHLQPPTVLLAREHTILKQRKLGMFR